MPVSSRNQKVIDGLQPEFGHQVALWVNDCEAEGLPLVLVEGRRSFGRSDDLFRQGRVLRSGKWVIVDRKKVVTNAPGGHSYHNFSLAVDGALLDARGRASWGFDPQGKVWQRVVALARGRGLAWGGDWRTFKDPPHFQPAAVPSLAECRRRWPRGFR